MQILSIILLVCAGVFLLLKFGLFGMNLNINLDLLYFDIGFLKLRLRVSPITILLMASWLTGLNDAINIPVWGAALIIFIGLPSLFETVFHRGEKQS